jgi:hypothetical protein
MLVNRRVLHDTLKVALVIITSSYLSGEDDLGNSITKLFIGFCN